MTALSSLLDHYRQSSLCERGKGTYVEELMLYCLRNQATCRDQHCEVRTLGQWAPPSDGRGRHAQHSQADWDPGRRNEAAGGGTRRTSHPKERP